MKEQDDNLKAFFTEYDYENETSYAQDLQSLLDFKESIYELAFGDDAINRDFTENEVIEKLREFSDRALLVEQNKQ